MKSLMLIVPVMVATLMMLFHPVSANEGMMGQYVVRGSASQVEEFLLDANTGGIDAIGYRGNGGDVLNGGSINCFPHICG